MSSFKHNIIKVLNENVVSLDAFRKPVDKHTIDHLKIASVEYVHHIDKLTGKKTALHSRSIRSSKLINPGNLSDQDLYNNVRDVVLPSFGKNAEHGTSMHYIPSNHENWEDWHDMYGSKAPGIMGRHIHHPDESEIKHEIHHLVQPIYKPGMEPSE